MVKMLKHAKIQCTAKRMKINVNAIALSFVFHCKLLTQVKQINSQLLHKEKQFISIDLQNNVHSL